MNIPQTANKVKANLQFPPAPLVNGRSIVVVLAAVGLVATVWAWSQYSYLPAYDWEHYFRPAARELLAGRSPYNIGGFYNPPWVMALFMPLALLPERIGGGFIVIASLVAYAYIANRLGAGKLATIALLLSMPVVFDMHATNINWLVALGFVMPPQIGLFFVLAKPQVGAAVALFWLVEAYRDGGIHKVITTFAPVGIALALSVAIFGPFWSGSDSVIDAGWNASIWPAGIPIGLVLLWKSIKLREMRYAMVASPFLSPYVAGHSWSIVLVGLLPGFEAVIASIGTWIYALTFML